MQPSLQEVSSAICGFTAAVRLCISSLEMRALSGSVRQGWHHCPDVARATCPSVLSILQGGWLLCLSWLCTPLIPLGKTSLECIQGAGGEDKQWEGHRR